MQAALSSLYSGVTTGNWTGEFPNSVLCLDVQTLCRDGVLLTLALTCRIFSAGVAAGKDDDQPCSPSKDVLRCFFFDHVTPQQWLVSFLSSNDRYVKYSACKTFQQILVHASQRTGVFQSWLNAFFSFLAEQISAAEKHPTFQDDEPVAVLLECLVDILQWIHDSSQAASHLSDVVVITLCSHTSILWPGCEQLQAHHLTDATLASRLLVVSSMLSLVTHHHPAQRDHGASDNRSDAIASRSTANVSPSAELLCKWLMTSVAMDVCVIVKHLCGETAPFISLSRCISYLRRVFSQRCIYSTSLPSLFTSAEKSFQFVCDTLVTAITLTLWYGQAHITSQGPGSCTPSFVSPFNPSDQRASVLLLLRGLHSLLDCAHTAKFDFVQKLLELPDVSTKLLEFNDTCMVCSMTSMFAEDDEDLFEAWSLMQSVFSTWQDTHLRSSYPAVDTVVAAFHPGRLFMHIAHAVSCDHLVFIDWLVSDETCCLSYFELYLRYVIKSSKANSGLADASNSCSIHPGAMALSSSPESPPNDQDMDPLDSLFARDNNPFRAALFQATSSAAASAAATTTAAACDGSDASRSSAVTAPRLAGLVAYSSSEDEESDDELESSDVGHRMDTVCHTHGHMDAGSLPLAFAMASAAVESAPTLLSDPTDPCVASCTGLTCPVFPLSASSHGSSPCLSNRQGPATAAAVDDDGGGGGVGSGAECAACAAIGHEELHTFTVRLSLLLDRLQQKALLPFDGVELLNSLTEVEDIFESHRYTAN
ncbi:uncharacterized protein LOC135808298 isoform X2 [Sycon ciliatum]|uniref:uncharacterized protein LOC135808298 isoform X2 n=1 Tax=Sycon ciliatum TaxID=27933 RepID=UPI0031F70D9C